MNTKLTLTIEQSIIDKVKKYASSKEQSITSLIESYLSEIAKSVNDSDIELTPIVKSLKGAFKAPDNFDYKKQISSSLSNKYN